MGPPGMALQVAYWRLMRMRSTTVLSAGVVSILPHKGEVSNDRPESMQKGPSGCCSAEVTDLGHARVGGRRKFHGVQRKPLAVSVHFAGRDPEVARVGSACSPRNIGFATSPATTLSC